jgi:LytS/YehU family sensor histidine kinase
VTHGLRGGMRTVAIEINAWRNRHQLFIYVGNTCSDCLPVRDVSRQGLGLRNVRTRLEMLFGPDATFQADRAGNGRFEVQIGLPARDRRTASFREDEPCV